jgi:hypothetical protein
VHLDFRLGLGFEELIPVFADSSVSSTVSIIQADVAIFASLPHCSKCTTGARTELTFAAVVTPSIAPASVSAAEICTSRSYITIVTASFRAIAVV